MENKIALIRLEQFCPFPYDLIKKELEMFKNAEIIFAQEEHKNQGAWSYVQPRFETAISLCQDSGRSINYAGRPVAAATATGNKQQFIKEVNELLTDVFGELSEEELESIKKKKEEKLKIKTNEIEKTENKKSVIKEKAENEAVISTLKPKSPVDLQTKTTDKSNQSMNDKNADNKIDPQEKK